MWVAASLKVQVYLKFELIRVHIGWPNSHKTIKQEPHTTKTEGTRRTVSVKTEQEEEEEEKRAAAG